MKMSRSPRCGAGFTLLEMLVTLTLVSLVAGIIWQAMGQLARIERLLGRSQYQSVAEAVRGEWLRAALNALTPGAANTAERFRGAEDDLQGLSAAVPR